MRTLGRLRPELEEEEVEAQQGLGSAKRNEAVGGNGGQHGVRFSDNDRHYGGEGVAPTMVVVHEDRLPTIRYPSRVNAPSSSGSPR